LYLYGEKIKIRCDVEVMDSFSAHADRGEIASFVRNQRGHVKKIYLVHGEIDSQEALRTYLGERGFPDIEIPTLGQTFSLD
jgi:metallo-beta-lactamase family protein